jgi:hypothetical protein
MERWLPIPGYEGRYEVSDQGRLRGPRYGLMTPVLKGGKYLGVTLRKDNVQRTHSVHSLVLLAFRGPRPPGLIARHRNSIKTDNWLSNLEYNTQSVNCQDKPFARVAPGCLTVFQVREIKRAFTEGLNNGQIAQRHGVDRSSVSRIRTGSSHRASI